MLLRELNRSGCKTYLLACEETRKGVLIDPVKERVDRYLGVPAYHRLALEVVIEPIRTRTTAQGCGSCAN